MDEIYDIAYSENWRNLGTVLFYQDSTFKFRQNVIILELDDCLIKDVTAHKLYNTLNPIQLQINEDLVRGLKKESVENSIVILSNQVSSSKLNTDMIKFKLEYFIKQSGLSVLAMFALIPNKFMKPHTGMWKLLNLYAERNYVNIKNTIVVSHLGGLIVDKNTHAHGAIKFVSTKDTDRAFAWNILADYYSIDEYLERADKEPPYQWDHDVISPELRQQYFDILHKMENVNIFQELAKLGDRSAWVIFIYGAPRCGKTRLAKLIIKKWRASEFGKHNAIERLDLTEFKPRGRLNKFKKLIDDRISVIIDGTCHNDELRDPFLEHIKDRNIGILYINVNIGLRMAKVLNHVAVEDATDEKTTLYKSREYAIYRSTYKKPRVGPNAILIDYYPKLETRETVMKYRYSP